LRRKLLLLNLVLVALIALAAQRVRQQYLAGQAREHAVLGRSLAPPVAPPVSRSEPAQPLTAASYIEIAEKMLFSNDRNPTVVVEAAPPPPKPMPPLPALHGVMSFPDGPVAMLSEKSGARHRGVRIGESIGPFKLLAVSEQEISFEWDGQTVVKETRELQEKSQAPPETAARTPGSAPAPAAAAPVAPRGQPAPGVPMGAGVRACQPGDTSPPGTVADGMRKVVTESPFGPVCRWEAVQ
jgi:hypothetical protein